jgi:predicted nucleotidyltransferase
MKDNTNRIITALLENGSKQMNIRQISQDIKMNYSNVHSIFRNLYELNLVSLEKHGKASEYSLIKKVNPLIFKAEYLRSKDLLDHNKDLKILQMKLTSLKFPFIALIFGSHAKKTASKSSDIDLMIISEKEREKEFERIINLLPLDIHLVALNFEEFLSMAKNTDFSVVSEAIKFNILLVGIEDYYRVLENVG